MSETFDCYCGVVWSRVGQYVMGLIQWQGSSSVVHPMNVMDLVIVSF